MANSRFFPLPAIYIHIYVLRELKPVSFPDYQLPGPEAARPSFSEFLKLAARRFFHPFFVSPPKPPPPPHQKRKAGNPHPEDPGPCFLSCRFSVLAPSARTSPKAASAYKSG
jgi:hypothetical protein